MPLFSRRKVENESSQKAFSAPASPAKPCQSIIANGNVPHPSLPDGILVNELHREKMALKDYEEPFLFVTPLKTKSRLSKTLDDIIHDYNALGFFIQFMDSRSATPYIKFWLDAESFRASAQTRLQSHSKCVDSLKGVKHLRDSKQELFKHHLQNDSFNSYPLSGSDTCLYLTPSETSNFTTTPSVYVDFNHMSSSIDTLASGDNCSNSYPQHRSEPFRDHKQAGDISFSATKPCKNTSVENSKIGLEDNSSFTHGLNDKLSLSSHEDVLFVNEHPDDVSDSCSNTNKDVDLKRRDGIISHSRSKSTDSNLIHKLKKSIAEDAVKIFTQYIAKEAALSIGVSDELRNEITAKICQEDGHVDPLCFVNAQKYVYEIMQQEYFPEYLLSDFHCKYQIDVLTSGKVHLEDILYNETALTFFMEFMEQEGKRHLLEFWLMTDNFRQHLIAEKGNYDTHQAQEDAMVLYDKYFSLQATCPLGFSDAIRFEVEQNICREEGPLPDCFEKPIKTVFHYLEKMYLKTFLTSQLYFTYLSELLNSSRSEYEHAGFKRRAGSDTSSEHSVSTQNTLLAMDSTQPGVVKKILKNLNHKDMRIDTGMFNNPEALWKRDMAGKLSFGRVSNLGQFIPELEPEPDKKKSIESVISKAMKKLVNKEEDKAKELMAWQIAEMIVKEVTSVTCPDLH